MFVVDGALMGKELEDIKPDLSVLHVRYSLGVSKVKKKVILPYNDCYSLRRRECMHTALRMHYEAVVLKPQK